MDLNQIIVFAAVVRAGSFTAAARELEMPKSTVSRKVSELEARLRAHILSLEERSVTERTEDEIPEGDLERLRSLGYIGG